MKTIWPRIRKRDDEGLALLAVMGYLAALMVLSGAFIALLHVTLAHARRAEMRQVCLNLGEAGIHKAVAELAAGHDQYRGEQDTPLGEGAYSVSVEPGAVPRAYRIRSTGFVRGGQFVLGEARVEAEVSISPDGAVAALRWMEAPVW
jgi:hypothetical protein